MNTCAVELKLSVMEGNQIKRSSPFDTHTFNPTIKVSIVFWASLTDGGSLVRNDWLKLVAPRLSYTETDTNCYGNTLKWMLEMICVSYVLVRQQQKDKEIETRSK